MNKKYILIIVSVILIGMIVISYAHNKQKKDHYIETQEKTMNSKLLLM
ncbi:exported protein [Staphylococcus aureus]|nr:exported protein [Staphylococcus aureus]